MKKNGTPLVTPVSTDTSPPVSKLNTDDMATLESMARLTSSVMRQNWPATNLHPMLFIVDHSNRAVMFAGDHPKKDDFIALLAWMMGRDDMRELMETFTKSKT